MGRRRNRLRRVGRVAQGSADRFGACVAQRSAPTRRPCDRVSPAKRSRRKITRRSEDRGEWRLRIRMGNPFHRVHRSSPMNGWPACGPARRTGRSKEEPPFPNAEILDLPKAHGRNAKIHRKTQKSSTQWWINQATSGKDCERPGNLAASSAKSRHFVRPGESYRKILLANRA